MTLWWLSPGDPGQRTGGYLWNARIAEALRADGHAVEVVALDGAWPMPGATRTDALERIPDGACVVADGLAWPGLGDAGRALAARADVVVVVHSLLSRETGVDPRTADALDALEVASWAPVRGLVATSRLTRDALAARTDRPRTLVIPGTRRAARGRGSDGATVVTVGTLTRRKGHDVLLDALAGVELPWRLVCVGAPRDPAWARELADRVARAGWSDRVTFAGDLDEAGVDTWLERADLVVQAAHYESFGMAIAEAVARGLPVLTRPAGVVDHLPADAVCVADDLGPDLRRLLASPEERRALAERAWAAAATLPDWTTQARALVDALRRSA